MNVRKFCLIISSFSLYFSAEKNISGWKKNPILSLFYQYWNAPRESTSAKFDEPASHLVRDAITLLKWLWVNQLCARNIIMNDFYIYHGSVVRACQ